MSFDLTAINPVRLEPVATVIGALAAKADVSPDAILLIGAHCRDLLHLAFGHHVTLRGTRDVDIALAVAGWDQYQQITVGFPKFGDTGIGFLIGGQAVDVIPFGDIEDPAGTAAIPHRREPIDVFAFREVLDRAARLNLPNGASVQLPSPAGFTALKLKAWCDRSPRHAYKDAWDIATACFWHRSDTSILDYLYGTEEGAELLLSFDFNPDRAILDLLGHRISNQIGPERTAELRTAWQGTDLDRFTEQFGRGLHAHGPVTDTVADVAALTRFLL